MPLQKLERDGTGQLLYEERKRWNKKQKEIQQGPLAP